MTEFLSGPDAAAAAQPASQAHIDQVAQAILTINDYPDFRSDWLSSSHRARYNVGRTAVTLSTPYGYDACIQLVEPLTEGDETAQFYRFSAYDFVRHGRNGNFKVAGHSISEIYLRADRQGLLRPAFSNRFRLDNRVTFSPLARHRKYKNSSEAEAIWSLGTLSVWRCGELLALAQQFDPAIARSSTRNRR